MSTIIEEITKVPTNTQVIKILNEVIKRYNSLGSIYTFKGSVQTYDDLLIIQNPNVGDVYNVIEEDAEHQVAAGSNFVWDGTAWDNLGGSLDGLVQSVNGISPDSLGNVLLPLIKNITTNQGIITFTKNDDTTIQVDNIKKLYMLTLGENINLNDLTESGIYICASNAYAANYENCPIQKAFLLEVQATVNGNFIYQFLTQYNDGTSDASQQYARSFYNNNWSAWRMAGSGSNLTTYTSLEQLDITPGEETFESIHNALPINSELIYLVVPNNFNNSIYPTDSYGNVHCIKNSDVSSTSFIFSRQNDRKLDIYTCYFNQNFPTDVVEWSLLAKQSDLTNAINSLGTISTKDMSNNSANLDKAAYITGDGVMEIGQYIDFHIAGSSNTDFDVRLQATEKGLYIQTLSGSGILGYGTTPVGTILPFAGGTIPEGFLACNGAAVSRTTYAALFSAIGTTYGSGDGSTTFNLPSVEDNRFLEFSGTRGTKKNAGLPNITGGVTNTGSGAAFEGASGAFWLSNQVNKYVEAGGSWNGLHKTLNISASNSSAIYGASTTVQPKSLTVRAIIKY